MALGAPQTPGRVLGLVLAGGRSTRWGSEKATAEVDGAPMVARVAAVLARGCEAVAVNARADGGAAAWARVRGLEVLPGPAGGRRAPLAGVLAGLEAAAGRGEAWLLTAPCDTPWLPADLAGRLLAGVGEAPAATAVTADGSHPLCTLWSAGLSAPLAEALAGGRHPSVRAWLREVGAAEVRFPDPRAFANLNTPPAARGPTLRLGLLVDALGLVLLTGLSLGGVGAFLFAATAFHAGVATDPAETARVDRETQRALVAAVVLAGMAVVAAARLALRLRERRLTSGPTRRI